MVARILPPDEWPRLAQTGCRVDRSWREQTPRGCVVSVEQGHAIVATAFVFVPDDAMPHVDGLWIDRRFRGRMSVLRPLFRAIKDAVEQLGVPPVISTDAAAWMTRPDRRAQGVAL